MPMKDLQLEKLHAEHVVMLDIILKEGRHF